jgi:hypothetical protein
MLEDFRKMFNILYVGNKFDRFVDRWLVAMTRGKETNYDKANASIVKLYQHIGLTAPKIVWSGSPFSLLTAYSMIVDDVPRTTWDKVIRKANALVVSSIGTMLHEAPIDLGKCYSLQFSYSLLSFFPYKLVETLIDKFNQRVSFRFGDTGCVFRALLDEVWNALDNHPAWMALKSKRARKLNSDVSKFLWNSCKDATEFQRVYATAKQNLKVIDAVMRRRRFALKITPELLCSYDILKKSLGSREGSSILSGLEHVSWLIPHQNVCFAAPPANMILVDERRCYHSESGPAVMYPDGWSIFAVHGILPNENEFEKAALFKHFGEQRLPNNITTVQRRFVKEFLKNPEISQRRFESAADIVPSLS